MRTRNLVTVKPIRDRDPNTYQCGWCGRSVKRGSGSSRTYSTCIDCMPLENTFGAKK